MYVRISAVLAALCLALSGSASAQVASTGTIQVTVEDQDGARLPGVTVTARATDAVTTRSAVSDGQGVATLEALAPSALYTVKIELQGFQEQTRTNILVRAGQTTGLRVQLGVAGLTEQVTVTAETPVVDVKSATTAQDITLQLTESLPTGRSYQSYLQLVPGVMPDDPTQGGNPAVRSGMNYSDVRGEMGISRDNVFYFDGINITDPVTGTFGANLNTEIIQEQRVVTGGIPAEFVGAPGLISNVVTKSGSNAFHGSVNYFFQNSNLVAENKNGAAEEFSTNDNGYTFGGPILRDRAWFFGSYRFNKRTDDVTSLDNDAFMRTAENTQHQGFAKGTWGPTASDLFSFTYLSDPTTVTGRRDRDITNARDRSREGGGDRFGALYTRVWGSTLLEIGANKHNGEVSDFSAIREARNDVIFQRTDLRTLNQEQLGGWGTDTIDQRDNTSVRGALQFTWKNHQFKGGLEWTQHDNFRDTLYVDEALYESLAPQYAGAAGVTAGQFVAGSWSRRAFDHTATSDFNGFIRTINARADRARFYGAFDVNGDGTITPAELGQTLVYSSTAGNPQNAVNYDRTLQVATGPQETSSKGMTFFVQDTFNLNRLTLNVGVRAEQWKHFATTGDDIFTFDWSFAPRLSAAYDLMGDGRHKVTGFYGRYYDPVRNNMTNFAGTLTGSVLDEQVYALGEWVTYRTRGGATVQDAFFSPTTKTPYTDDMQYTYAVDLGKGMSFEGVYWQRWTRNILEDYDLGLYASGPEGYGGDINAPESLYLGLDYFGYAENPGSNFVIGTLKGGKRDYKGLDFVFRKRFENGWQALTSYSWMDAKGNSNSDSNADFQGDVLFLDPRAPNVYATQPGTIHHLIKGAASYQFNMGLQLGAVFNWNSGTVASRTFLTSNRNLPIQVAASQAYEFGGVVDRWVAEGSVGTIENPSFGTIDLRAQYNRRIGPIDGEVFVDLFNVANNQGAIREQDLVAGQGTVAFGDPIQWITPRRAFVGVRVKF